MDDSLLNQMFEAVKFGVVKKFDGSFASYQWSDIDQLVSDVFELRRIGFDAITDAKTLTAIVSHK